MMIKMEIPKQKLTNKLDKSWKTRMIEEKDIILSTYTHLWINPNKLKKQVDIDKALMVTEPCWSQLESSESRKVH